MTLVNEGKLYELLAGLDKQLLEIRKELYSLTDIHNTLNEISNTFDGFLAWAKAGEAKND